MGRNAAQQTATHAHEDPIAGPATGANDNESRHGVFQDRIAATRHQPITSADAIARVPDGYAPTDTTERIRRFRRMSDVLMPQAMRAGHQVMSRRAQWPQDLGDLAPNLGPLETVLEEIPACEATISALTALLSYHQERYDILRGDLHAMLQSAHDEYAHRVTRRQRLAQDYGELAALFDRMGDAIAEGIAQSRRTARKPTEPTG